MANQLPDTDGGKSVSGRLRVFLTFLKDMGEEELKHFPVLRGFVAAVEKLSDQEASRETAQKTERLLTIGEHTRDDIEILKELATLIFQLQVAQGTQIKSLIGKFKIAGVAANQKQLTQFAVNTALTAYRSRIACDYMYADYRGIEGITRSDHAVSFLLDDVYVLPRLRSEHYAHPVKIEVTCIDQPGLLAAISSAITRADASITRAQIRTYSPQKAINTFFVMIKNPEHLDHVLQNISKVKGVYAATRARGRTGGKPETQQRDQTNVSERERELLDILMNRPEEISPEERLRLEERYAAITGDKWRVERNPEEAGTSLGEVLRLVRHLVVIGAPGTGKSTLIRNLARQCALGEAVMLEHLGWAEQLIPIVVSIAAFADARSRQSSVTLTEFIDKQMTDWGGEALCAAIKHELRGGRALMLLDGVDEVPNLASRSSVIQSVERFIADHSRNRFILTSRPYGYIRIKGNLPHFELTNFSLEEVITFVEQWELAYEKWQHPNSPNLGHAKNEAKAVLEEIQRNPRIEELATNPLMLVIIVLIRYERARLPDQRVQLYNRAVATLMDTWNYWRSLAGIDLGGVQLPLDHLIRVWGKVAEWMRRTKPTGIVHRTELKRKLIEVLKELEYDEDDPEITAESYLNAAANRTGLLEERGPGIFGFWHPTFEEFLAAVELATPTSKAIERLLPLRDDPRWREVILLSVGYIGIVQRDGETATQIIEAIAEKEHDPSEILLHSHLRLAASCIADNVGAKRSLTERIIIRLADVIKQLPYELLTQAFSKFIRVLPNLRPTPEIVASLTPLTKHTSEVRWAIVPLLANAAADNPQARTACGVLLTDTDLNVSYETAIRMARGGDNRNEVWSVLADHHLAARNEAALRDLVGNVPAKVITNLVPLLSSGDLWLRISTARLLSDLGHVNQQVVEALVSCLITDDFGLYTAAARLLAELGRADEQLLNRVGLSLNDDDFAVRIHAAEILFAWGVADERVARAIGPCLAATDVDLRIRAADLLFDIGQADEHVVEALVSCLKAGEWITRVWAAQTFSRLELPDERAVEILVPCLYADDFDERLAAVWALSYLNRTDDRTVDALISCLGTDNTQLRLEVAKLLIKLGHTDEQVVAALISCLQTDDLRQRIEVVELLVQLGRADERAVTAMISSPDSEDFELLTKQLDLLARLGRVEQVVEAVVKLIDPQNLIALGACGKLIRKVSFNVDDSKALFDIVCAKDTERGEQQWARTWLFNWLSQTIESRHGP